MLKFRGTPGPWQYDGQTTSIGNNYFLVVGPPSHPAVANVWLLSPVMTENEESEANAQAIAIVPQLIEEMIEIITAFERPSRQFSEVTRREMQPWLNRASTLLSMAIEIK